MVCDNEDEDDMERRTETLTLIIDHSLILQLLCDAFIFHTFLSLMFVSGMY